MGRRTPSHQLTMLREAARVGEPGKMLELVDAAQDLLDNGWAFETVATVINLPVQGNVSSTERLREGLEIANAWPPEALEVARRYRADWHALREPARWFRRGDVDRNAVTEFAYELVDRKGRWPTTDEFRRRFGYEDGHKQVHDQQQQLDGAA